MSTTIEQRDAIDQLAKIRKKLKTLEAEEKALKELLKPLGVGVFKGHKFYAFIEECTNSGFDADALKANTPTLIWKPYWKVTSYLKISVKAALPAKKAA